MRSAVTLLLFLLLCSSIFGQSASGNTDSIKAAFVIDLINNVEWPANINKDSLVICVVGDTAIVPELKKAAALSAGKGSKMTVNSASFDEGTGNCQIMFIASGALPDLAKALKSVEGTPTLTVSSQKDFSRYGVMVNIREVKNGNVVFAVNKMAARHANIKIDPKLIQKAVETFG